MSESVLSRNSDFLHDALNNLTHAHTFNFELRAKNQAMLKNRSRHEFNIVRRYEITAAHRCMSATRKKKRLRRTRPSADQNTFVFARGANDIHEISEQLFAHGNPFQ